MRSSLDIKEAIVWAGNDQNRVKHTITGSLYHTESRLFRSILFLRARNKMARARLSQGPLNVHNYFN